MNWNQLILYEFANVLTIPMEKNDHLTIRFLSCYQIISITTFLLYIFFNLSKIKPNQYHIGLGYFRFIYGFFTLLYYCFTLNQQFNNTILLNICTLALTVIKNAEYSNEMVDYNIISSESIPYLSVINDFPDNTECTICLDTIIGNCTKLKCNHYFHLNCIRNWMLRGNSTCPICRTQIFSRNENSQI